MLNAVQTRRYWVSLLERARGQIILPKIKIKALSDITDDLLGFVEDKDGGFIMACHTGLSRESVFDTFVHELAHVIAGPHVGHSAAWGVAYAQVYRLLMDTE